MANIKDIRTRFEFLGCTRADKYAVCFDSPVEMSGRGVTRDTDRLYTVSGRVFRQLAAQCRYYFDLC